MSSFIIDRKIEIKLFSLKSMICNFLQFLESVFLMLFILFLCFYFYMVMSLTNNPQTLETRGKLWI